MNIIIGIAIGLIVMWLVGRHWKVAADEWREAFIEEVQARDSLALRLNMAKAALDAATAKLDRITTQRTAALAKAMEANRRRAAERAAAKAGK